MEEIIPFISIFEEFADNDKAVTYLESIRWKDGVSCPYCNTNKTCKHHDEKRSRWQCWNCKTSFAVTVGTIFHRTHVPLNKWFWLIAVMLNAKKGLSSSQAARVLDIRQPTAWSMMNRIRKAIDNDQTDLLKSIFDMVKGSMPEEK